MAHDVGTVGRRLDVPDFAVARRVAGLDEKPAVSQGLGQPIGVDIVAGVDVGPHPFQIEFHANCLVSR